MFMFINFNDGTRTVETYESAFHIQMNHGIDVTEKMLQGQTVYEVMCGQEVEIGFTDARTFDVSPDGSIEFCYYNDDDEEVTVSIFGK